MMRNMMRSTCLVAVLVAGCATAGVKVAPEQLAQFQPGVTPCTEIVATLEKPPTSQSLHSDGSRQLTYAYQHWQADATTVGLAVIGIPAGRSEVEHATVVVECDRADRLMTYTATKGAHSRGVGVTGGAKQ